MFYQKYFSYFSKWIEGFFILMGQTVKECFSSKDAG